ncbi:staphylococcal-like nuclease CAN1 [Bidens hawaiensis]|uniref:staphylococcal-like nuclease CAN1 n=1 Tax=Bidens hawaiensis TaxID=980011 RepID=UPI00404AC77D
MIKRRCTEPGGLGGFERDLLNFELTSQIPDGFGDDDETLQETTKVTWYTELLLAWKASKPQTPEDASKLVFDMMCKIYPHYFYASDLLLIWGFYNLPCYKPPPKLDTHEEEDGLPLRNTHDEDATLNTQDENEDATWNTQDENEDATWNTQDEDEDASLNTQDEDEDATWNTHDEDEDSLNMRLYAVKADQVTDGAGLTVFVEVESSYVLSSAMLLLIDERRKALARKDDNRARELLNEINATEDYKMQRIHDVDILTRKYEIRLREISVPGIETSDGIEARDELARMVDGKCLSIYVYYLDDKKRCVGDVFCEGSFSTGFIVG